MVKLHNNIKLLTFIVLNLMFVASRAQSTSVGTDFWMAITRQADTTHDVKLMISSAVATSGNVSIPATVSGWNVNFNVAANSTIVVSIPTDSILPSSRSGTRSRSVHITSCKPVSVIATTHAPVRTASTIVLPTQTLGTDYYVATYPGNVNPPDEIILVATENNTNITITPTNATARGQAANVPFTINLNAGLSYWILSANSGTFDGSHITSDKPIAVFAGAGDIYIPASCATADPLWTAMLPTNLLGTDYVIPPLAAVGEWFVHIVATQNNTQVSVDGGAPFNLNAGQYNEQNFIGGVHCVSADKPVLVAQIFKSKACSGGGLAGDADMVVMNPVNLTAKTSIFQPYNLSGTFNLHYVNVVMKSAYTGQLQLNGSPVAGAFTAACNGYSYITIPIAGASPGTQILKADSGFTAYMYGYPDIGGTANEESYSANLGFGDYPVGVQPTVKITSDSTDICPLSCVNISLASASPGFSFTYSWSNLGFGPGPFQVCPSKTTTYYLTATTVCDTAKDSVMINVKPSCNNLCPVCINNPSLESAWDTCSRNSIAGVAFWAPCKGSPDSENQGCTSMQSVPGPLQIPPSDGNWTIGMVAGLENFGGSFCAPLPPGTYTLSVDLALAPGSRGNDDPSYLKIFLGNANCDSSFLAIQSGPIANQDRWVTYTQTFTTTSTFTTLFLNAYDADLSNSNLSYMVVDNLRMYGVCDKPVVAIQDTAICTGACATLKPTVLGGAGTLTYSWSPGGVTTDSLQVCPSTSTKYFVTVTDGAGKTDTDSATVNVTPPPLPSASPDTSICFGTSATLTASGGGTYSWSGNGISCSTCSTVTIIPTATSVYTVSVTNGCTASDTVTVSVNTANITATGDVPSVCPGQPVNLSAFGGVTYTWTPPSGNITCSTCSTTTAFPAATTIYTVVGTDANGCTGIAQVPVSLSASLGVNGGADTTICTGGSVNINVQPAGLTYTWNPDPGLSCYNCGNPTATPFSTTSYIVAVSNGSCVGADTITITVSPPPLIDAGQSVNICQGSGATLNAQGGVTYSWAPSSSLNCDTCQAPVATPTTTTLYTLTGFVNGCFAMDTVSVIVNAPPIVKAGPDVSICAGGTTTLSATGGVTYVWDPPIGLTCPNCSSTVASPAVTTTYIVTGTDANLCTGTDTVVVTVGNTLSIDAGPDQDICIGSSVLLSPIPTGAGSYTWSASGTVVCACESTPVTPLVTTVYQVEVTAGLCTGTDSITIRVHQPPAINAGADAIVCQGTSSTLQASGGVQYSWSPSTYLSCDTCGTTIVTPFGDTQYILTGTDAFGCSNTDTINITITPGPIAVIAPDTSINIGQTVQLFASGGLSYQWTPETGLDCPGCQSPNATPSATTIYCVTISDSSNCVANDCMTVKVDYNCSEVFVPNAFSPNGDHNNDLECVLGNCIVSMTLSIYDRWGEKVFETDSPKACWDGVYNGKELNAAVFAYFLKATLITGETIQKKGNISLIR